MFGHSPFNREDVIDMLNGGAHCSFIPTAVSFIMLIVIKEVGHLVTSSSNVIFMTAVIGDNIYVGLRQVVGLLLLGSLKAGMGSGLINLVHNNGNKVSTW